MGTLAPVRGHTIKTALTPPPAEKTDKGEMERAQAASLRLWPARQRVSEKDAQHLTRTFAANTGEGALSPPLTVCDPSVDGIDGHPCQPFLVRALLERPCRPCPVASSGVQVIKIDSTAGASG